MTVVQFACDVDAPPDQVWKVVSDPRNLSLWDRRIVGVEGVPDGGVSRGSRYSTEVRMMGVGARIGAQVLELREPRYAKIRLRGVVDATVETTLEPLGRNRTRLRQRVDYTFGRGVVARLASEAVRRLGAPGLLRRGVLAQKLQAEQLARAS